MTIVSKKPSKPPVAGEFYRLANSRCKNKGQTQYGYNSGDWVERGIYVVESVDQNQIKLRLVSKHEFHGSGRRWIKKSKMTDEISHTDFINEYEDDAFDYLKEELDKIKDSYANVLGDSV